MNRDAWKCELALWDLSFPAFGSLFHFQASGDQ